MTLAGHVENGRIVLDPSVPLPEGAKVRIEVLAEKAEGESDDAIPTLYERLRNVVGMVKNMPADASIDHDHYLYGHPKQ